MGHCLADKVDDVIKSQMERQKIPGVALLITRDDKPVKTAAYGLADIELNVPMKPDMLFESGSISKCFTATVIMQLWEQGKIGLDDPLSKYILNSPEAWKDIKIRNLLGHTSGLKDYALVPGLGLIEQWTTDQWFAKMTTLPLDFPTGSAWAYSNSNFLLLGLVAQKITGHSIDDLVRDQVFKPLDMKRSFLSDQETIVPGRVKGYWQSETGLINGYRIGVGYGDGGHMNDCEDLAIFERGIREAKLLKPATVAMMQTAGVLPSGRKAPYGFGWFVRTVNGHRYISHGGNTGGFGSSIFRVPEKNLTIVVMTNLASVSGDTLAQAIAEAYEPDLAPKPLVTSPDPDPAFSERLKTALIGLANEDTTQDIFDPEMTERLTTGRGRMGLAGFVPFKVIDSFVFCQSEASDPDTILRYRVKVAGKNYIVGFVVTKDKKLFQVGARAE